MRAMAKLAFTLLFFCGGCATAFVGDAHFPGGPSGCAKHCDQSGLAMDSFVYMGEYSSACVCKPKAGALASPSSPSAAAAGGASAGAAAGVVMAMREREREREREANNNMASMFH